MMIDNRLLRSFPNGIAVFILWTKRLCRVAYRITLAIMYRRPLTLGDQIHISYYYIELNIMLIFVRVEIQFIALA